MTQSHIRNVYPSAIYKQRELMYFDYKVLGMTLIYNWRVIRYSRISFGGRL